MPVAQPKAMTFVCPCCKETIRVPESYAGRAGRCPRCKGAIRLPSAERSGKPPKPGKMDEAPAPTSKRAVGEDAGLEAKMFSSGMLGGVAAMVVAVIWFCVGWSAGTIFLYPPVMFFCGLGAVIKAACEKPLPRGRAAAAASA